MDGGSMNRFGSPEVLILVLFAFLISITGEVSALNADFLMKPTQGQVPLTVFFVDSSSGAPSDWRWDFGDGSAGEGRQIMHTYLQPGLYTVSMTVSDESDSDTRTIPDAILAVSNPFYSPIPTMPGIKPSFIADFKVSKRSGTAPLQIQFTDLSVGDPVSWEWDFGDGGTDSSQNPIHIYTKAGKYPVKLSIRKEGSTSSKEEKNYISVSEGQAIASMNTMAANQTGGREYVDLKSSSDTSIMEKETDTPISMDEAGPVSTPESFPTGEKYSLLNTPLIDFYNKTQELFTSKSPQGLHDGLTIRTNPEMVKTGESFVSVISGNPGEDVYVWVVVPESIAGSENPVIPFLTSNQTEVMRDYPTGPYQIGSFVPSGENNKISLRSLIPEDTVYQGTASYGLIRLNQTGTATLMWETTGVVPGKYFIRAESKTGGTSSARIQAAASSLVVT